MLLLFYYSRLELFLCEKCMMRILLKAVDMRFSNEIAPISFYITLTRLYCVLTAFKMDNFPVKLCCFFLLSKLRKQNVYHVEPSFREV